MITSINEFKKLLENVVTLPTEPNTITLQHGGNLDNIDDRSHKGGQQEHGPGLYLTSSYQVVSKYAKGSRKLYLVTVEKGIDLKDKNISLDIVNEFINSYVIKSKIKNVKERINIIVNRLKLNNEINAETFLNIIINESAIKNTDTINLKRFFIKCGIDYYILSNVFGQGETMIVVYNNDKIKQIKQITPKDKIETYDLPLNFII